MEYISVDAIITICTIFMTIIIGELSKRFSWIEKKSIPLQNIIIGLIVCAVQYFITKDINVAVSLSGLMSGGAYDACKAFAMLFSKEEE